MKSQAIITTLLLLFSIQLVQAQRSDRYERDRRIDRYEERYDDRNYCPPRNERPRNTREYDSRRRTRGYQWGRRANRGRQNQRIREYNRLFDSYDRNNDNRLKYSEFNDLRINGRKIQDARRKFKRIDWDDNGSISRREFIDALNTDRLY